MKFTYKHLLPFEIRRSRAEKALRDNPGKLPVIVERWTRDNLMSTHFEKLLIPCDASVLSLNILIRRKFNLRPEETIYLDVNNTILSPTMIMGPLYQEHRDEDKGLYVAYCPEDTFGQ